MKKKNITVYWSCLEKESIRSQEPVDIYKEFIKTDLAKRSELLYCPSFKGHMNNTYGLRSIYDYDFSIKNNNIKTDDYDQTFFDDHLIIRSIEDQLFSFRQSFIFFTEEDSLEMSSGISPFLEKNFISSSCSVIPGRMDIGKWFRMLDFAFIINNSIDHFRIREGDIFQYIQFHTDQKITFKQFYCTDKIKNYAGHVDMAGRNRHRSFKKIDEYYAMLRFKNNIVKEIKDNLIE